VAVGIQRTAVDVAVSLHLDRRNSQALVLQQLGHGRGKDSLAQPAHDGSDNDDEFVEPLAVSLRHGGVKFGLLRGLADLREQVFVGHKFIVDSE